MAFVTAAFPEHDLAILVGPHRDCRVSIALAPDRALLRQLPGRGIFLVVGSLDIRQEDTTHLAPVRRRKDDKLRPLS